jgi:hypothetical protein
MAGPLDDNSDFCQTSCIPSDISLQGNPLMVAGFQKMAPAESIGQPTAAPAMDWLTGLTPYSAIAGPRAGTAGAYHCTAEAPLLSLVPWPKAAGAPVNKTINVHTHTKRMTVSPLTIAVIATRGTVFTNCIGYSVTNAYNVFEVFLLIMAELMARCACCNGYAGFSGRDFPCATSPKPIQADGAGS